jgi:tRNA (guanine-N7-)-methyltransferase
MEPQPRPPAAPPSWLYRPESFFERLELGRVFAQPRPLEVELGCGDSNFIVELARRHPDRNFLGIERLMGRLRKLERKGRRLGLHNLRGLRIEAAYCLEYLLPLESVSRLHVYFPDPWPKRKHWPRRLVNERFPELAGRVLVPGGMVCLRTDDLTYFDQMLRVFAASPEFAPAETPADLGLLLTDFERDFLAQGKETRRAAYVRKG